MPVDRTERRMLVRYASGHTVTVTGQFWGPGYVVDTPGGAFAPVTMEGGWPDGMEDDRKIVMVLLTRPGIINGQAVKADNVVMLDPRAVVQDRGTGARIFEPRATTPGTCRWVVEWLAEHPEWPPSEGRA